MLSASSDSAISMACSLIANDENSRTASNLRRAAVGLSKRVGNWYDLCRSTLDVSNPALRFKAPSFLDVGILVETGKQDSCPISALAGR